MPAGRPSDFSADLGERLCEEIAKGRSVRDICGEDWAPVRSTFFLWLYKHPEFSDLYANAKAALQESQTEEMLEIADDATPDTVHLAKLRIDTRKWLASKLKPKKYGDKLDIDANVGMTINLPKGSSAL